MTEEITEKQEKIMFHTLGYDFKTGIVNTECWVSYPPLKVERT